MKTTELREKDKKIYTSESSLVHKFFFFFFVFFVRYINVEKEKYNKDKVNIYTNCLDQFFFAQIIRAYLGLVDFLSSFFVRIGDGERDRLDESLLAGCGFFFGFLSLSE